MRRRLRLAAVALVVAFAAPTAHADMAAGVAAVRAGDFTAAVREFLALAEAGHALAQYNLAQMYRLGTGVSQDDATAAVWYRRAAEAGLPYAQHNLAMLYLDGRGVEQDRTQSVAWWRRAALQGHAVARYSLAVAYATGLGVNRNYIEALAWFNLAAADGYEPARRAGLDLGQHMTGDERQAAARRTAVLLEASHE